MNRTHFSQLPQSQELAEIMKKEVFRPIPQGKESTHFVNFQTIKHLLNAYEQPTQFFDLDVNPDEVINQGLLEQGSGCIATLINAILSAEATFAEKELLDAAYNYLAESDPIQPADLIFVFGAKTPLRIEKAIELFNAGLAPKIMVSGGSPFYSDDMTQSEAEHYADLAIKCGIPKKNLIIETQAITVADNVRRSLNLLEEESKIPQKIILVNSPYVQRRGWAFFNKYLPDGCELVRVNSGTAEKYRADHWYKTEDGLNVILNEFVKLKIAVSLNTA